MATRKQKNAAALAKREKALAAERAVGLAALTKAQEERRRQELEAWQEQHDKKHSWKKRIVECPHCQIEIAISNKAGRKSIEETI